MTQLVLEGMALPETWGDKYACWEEILSVQLDMISGRRVIEERGAVWKIKWSYDYLDNDTTRALLAVLRSRRPILAAALPDNSSEMISSTFVVESLTDPTFLFDDNGTPCWHGLGFVLREEEPHD